MSKSLQLFVIVIAASAISPMQQYLSSLYPYKPIWTQDIVPEFQLNYYAMSQLTWQNMSGFSF